LAAFVCCLVLLGAIMLSPSEPRPRITATLIQRVELYTKSPEGLIFSVSNLTSRTLEASIGLKQQPPDYPRGGNAILPGSGSTNLQVDATRLPSPWTVRIVSRRIPGPLETKARAFGARFRLCEPTPKLELETDLTIKE
jgi:hypothetical protein